MGILKLKQTNEIRCRSRSRRHYWCPRYVPIHRVIPTLPFRDHQELFSPTLSNNSLTAPSRTQDVMEDSWTTLSSTLRTHHSCSRPNTHTLPRMEEHANMSAPRELVRLLTSRMSPKMSQASNLWPPSLRAQSPLPLKPINSPSRDIPVVSSPQDVARNSTTVFSLSVMVRDISSSRTHGVPHGVLTDTSRWPQASAVSPPPLPSHPSDSLIIQFNYFQLIQLICNIATLK